MMTFLMTPDIKDVVIVGAGWSGLVAASSIQKHNAMNSAADAITFHVFEAENRTGGRTLNEDVVSEKQSVSTDAVVELGGEWLAPVHTAAIELMRDEEGFPLFHRCVPSVGSCVEPAACIHR